MDNVLNEIKEYWDKVSDSGWYASLRTDDSIEALKKVPESAFHLAVFELLQKHMKNFRGKRVLLPSSGDNHAAFAFALMGAEVFSADISERQLENAQKIAEKLELDMKFVCDDTMKLEKFEDDTFDLVYTSNGTLTWIYDLNGMFRNISRVLKKDGIYVLYDIHPFTRPFSMKPWENPEIVKAYSDVMPSLHWRVQDILNASVGAGLSLCETAELPAVDGSFWYTYEEIKNADLEKLKGINDWHENPMAALPAWLALVLKKN